MCLSHHDKCRGVFVSICVYHVMMNIGVCLRQDVFVTLWQTHEHNDNPTTRDNIPSVIKNMHIFKKKWQLLTPSSLKAFLMDIHHNTSFKFILEDDSISSTSKACICFCLGKGVGLWLIVRPFIHSFHITHSTFTLKLCFSSRFDLTFDI